MAAALPPSRQEWHLVRVDQQHVSVSQIGFSHRPMGGCPSLGRVVDPNNDHPAASSALSCSDHERRPPFPPRSHGGQRRYRQIMIIGCESSGILLPGSDSCARAFRLIQTPTSTTCLLTMSFAVGLVLMSGLRPKVGAILIGIWAVGLPMLRFGADSAPLGQLLNE